MGAVEIPGSGCLALWNRIWGGLKQWSERERSHCQVFSMDLMPPSSPLKHIQLVHAHTCAERERKRGGLRMDRERKAKRRREYNKENRVWNSNIVQSGRQWPEHVFLTVNNSYNSLILPELIPGASCLPIYECECMICGCFYLCLWIPAWCRPSCMWQTEVDKKQRETGGMRTGVIKGQGSSHGCQKGVIDFPPLLSCPAATRTPNIPLSDIRTLSAAQYPENSVIKSHLSLSLSPSLFLSLTIMW